MNNAAVTVGHDLKFNVVRVHDQLLDVNIRISESLLRFESRGVISLDQTRFIVRGAHAATPATRDCFDHHRIADLLRERRRFLSFSTTPSLPGVTGTPALRA